MKLKFPALETIGSAVRNYLFSSVKHSVSCRETHRNKLDYDKANVWWDFIVIGDRCGDRL